MEIPFILQHQGEKYYGKYKDTEVGRGLRYGGKSALKAMSHAYESIPRALAWAVPNALYTTAYIPLVAYSLAAKAYNAAWGTQNDGRRDGNRRWYNHCSRFHLRPDNTSASPLPYPGTMLSWKTVQGIVPGPEPWHAPDYPAAPADPNEFNPNEASTGIVDRSPRWREQYVRQIGNWMLQDAGKLAMYIRDAVCPPGHPRVGQPLFGNLARLFKLAAEIEQSELLEPSEDVDQGSEATLSDHDHDHAAGDRRAIEEGYKDAADVLICRNEQMTRIFALNVSHYNNMIQMRLECEEAQETLKLIERLYKKAFLREIIWGYLEYKSAFGAAADKADNRLRGLLQEVDPLGSRRQVGPFGI